MERPDFFELNNGEKVKLPFSDIEYKNRVSKLRDVMSNNNMDMAILTSMHNIAYYTGFKQNVKKPFEVLAKSCSVNVCIQRFSERSGPKVKKALCIMRFLADAVVPQCQHAV